MSLFISHFRPWCIALLVLIGMESGYYYLRHPDRFDRTCFLEHRFANDENIPRLFVYEKVRHFVDSAPDIVQVGDSSGLYGIIPHVVLSYLPGYKYANLSAATTVGHDGFLYLAQLMLERNRTVKYLVVYNTPVGGLPRDMLWKKPNLLSHDIYDQFLDPLHTALQLPTLEARRDVINYLCYMNGNLKGQRAPLANNDGYLMFNAIFRSTFGWARETDNTGDIQPDMKAYLDAQVPQWIGGGVQVNPEYIFDWPSMSQRSFYDIIYSKYAKLAKKHKVKLVILFNPVPESIRKAPKEFFDGNAIMVAIDQLRAKYPEVYFPQQIEYWPDDKFSVFSHIATPHAVENSERVGKILKGIIGDDAPTPRSPDFLSSGAPIAVDLPFNKPFAGYHWLPSETNGAQWWRYIGPQGRAYIYTVVKPGATYRVRTYVQASASQADLDGLTLSTFGQTLPRTWSGLAAPYKYLEWDVPQSLINRYHGWLELCFSLPVLEGALPNDKAVPVSRVVLTRDR
jgi:hypothetical protein